LHTHPQFSLQSPQLCLFFILIFHYCHFGFLENAPLVVAIVPVVQFVEFITARMAPVSDIMLEIAVVTTAFLL
jgi:hypothetical protein